MNGQVLDMPGITVGGLIALSICGIFVMCRDCDDNSKMGGAVIALMAITFSLGFYSIFLTSEVRRVQEDIKWIQHDAKRDDERLSDVVQQGNKLWKRVEQLETNSAKAKEAVK